LVTEYMLPEHQVSNGRDEWLPKTLSATPSFLLYWANWALRHWQPLNLGPEPGKCFAVFWGRTGIQRGPELQNVLNTKEYYEILSSRKLWKTYF
jgi:hypothetical protein